MSGWKSWSIGEVVEAGDFQSFVQDQVVQTYADSAARSTALGTAVAEGMMAFTTDDDNLAVYANNNWNTVSQAISHNYIINGAFDIWQRGTSFSLANAFFADRWIRYTASGAAAITREAFSAGELGAIGFGDASHYMKMDFTTGANFQGTAQRVEDVRTLAGQTVTLSFWAKGTNPGTGGINVYIDQDFGSGGSSRNRNLSVTRVLTSDWQRFTVTGTLGSMAGKTIGAGNYIEITFRQTGVSADPWELNIWGVQLEAGSVATPFRRNANSIQGELAACKRYYTRFGGQIANQNYGTGQAQTTTEARVPLRYPEEMRATPTITFPGTASLYIFQSAGSNRTPSAITAAQSNTTDAEIRITTTSLTAGQAGNFISNSTSAIIELTAEL
jgi:hypothetical protein